jgi:hypothetical protein
VRVLRAWCESESGEELFAIGQGETCVACMDLEFDDAIQDPVFAITFRNDVRHTIFVARSDTSGPTGSFGAGKRSTVRFAFVNWLAASKYTLTPAVLTSDTRSTIDQRIDCASLIANTERITGGVADLPTALRVDGR